MNCGTIGIANSSREEEDSVYKYLPKEKCKPFIGQLLNYMSEDDAREVLKIISAYLEHNPEVKISAGIQTSILQFLIGQV